MRPGGASSTISIWKRSFEGSSDEEAISCRRGQSTKTRIGSSAARFWVGRSRLSSLDHSRLEDIRVYRAIELVGSKSADAFRGDVAVRLAVLHCLTLIGEAANQISSETKSV